MQSNIASGWWLLALFSASARLLFTRPCFFTTLGIWICTLVGLAFMPTSLNYLRVARVTFCAPSSVQFLFEQKIQCFEFFRVIYWMILKIMVQSLIQLLLFPKLDIRKMMFFFHFRARHKRIGLCKATSCDVCKKTGQNERGGQNDERCKDILFLFSTWKVFLCLIKKKIERLCKVHSSLLITDKHMDW